MGHNVKAGLTITTPNLCTHVWFVATSDSHWDSQASSMRLVTTTLVTTTLGPICTTGCVQAAWRPIYGVWKSWNLLESGLEVVIINPMCQTINPWPYWMLGVSISWDSPLSLDHTVTVENVATSDNTSGQDSGQKCWIRDNCQRWWFALAGVHARSTWRDS